MTNRLQDLYDEIEHDYAADGGYGDALHDPRPRLLTPHMSLEMLMRILDERFPLSKGMKP